MAKKRTVVSVTLKFSVDPDTWGNEYGLDEEQQIQDLKNYLPELVKSHVEGMPHVKLGIVDLVTRSGQ